MAVAFAFLAAGCGDEASTSDLSASDSTTSTTEAPSADPLSAVAWIEAADAVCARANDSLAAQPSNVDEMSYEELQEGADVYQERMAELEALTPASEIAPDVESWLAIERERTALVVALAEAGSVEAAADLMDEQAGSGAMEDLNYRGMDASIAIAQAADVDWYGC
jgi:hypothetical protein